MDSIQATCYKTGLIWAAYHVPTPRDPPSAR